MTEKDTVKDLMSQAANVKHLVDGITVAYAGVTIEELIKQKGAGDDETTPKQSNTVSHGALDERAGAGDCGGDVS